MADPRVVVIVPCVSWNPYVAECLAGCLALEFDDYRVVLLPDEPLASGEQPRDDRVLVLPTGEVSIAAKRNRAVREHPTAAYYAMIDSDAFPDPGWLREAVACFSRPEPPWAVGGPNLTPPGDPRRQRVVGAAQRSVMVSGYGAFAKRRSPSRAVSSLTTCNLVVRGEAMRSVGGFREELETAEDRDLCARILRAGGGIRFHREAVVFHHDRPLGAPLFMQRLTYGCWAITAIRDNPRAFDLPQLIPLLAFLAMAGGFALGSANPAFALAGFAILLSYCGLLATETARHCDRKLDLPLVLLAIATANTGFLAGNLCGLAGCRLHLRRVYRNYHGNAREPGSGRPGCGAAASPDPASSPLAGESNAP